ncbi:MAG: ribonuclease P protein component [Bacteroidota bacterium]
MRNTFKKDEKLKKKKLIEELFSSGKAINAYPIKLIYLQIEHDSLFKIQAGVSVSKRNFKKAVDRNRIKRLLREVYRKNKHIIYESEHTKKHIFMFIYVGKKEEKYDLLEKKMQKVLHLFLKRVNNENL